MDMTQNQRKQLHMALVSALPNEPALERMLLFELDQKLTTVAQGIDLADTIFKLIQWAEAHGRIPELIAGAQASNSGNTLLAEIAAQWKTPTVRATPSSQVTPDPRLSVAATLLVQEKPPGWEYRLFAQVLSDEIKAADDIRRLHQLGIALGPVSYIKGTDFRAWSQAAFAELSHFAAASSILLNNALPKAVGDPGIAGDAQDIILVAQQLSEIYRGLINWSQRVRRTKTDALWQSALTELEDFPNEMITTFETFSRDVYTSTTRLLEQLQAGETPDPVELTLRLEGPPNTQKFLDELARIRTQL